MPVKNTGFETIGLNPKSKSGNFRLQRIVIYFCRPFFFSTPPHKFRNRNVKGLSADEEWLCEFKFCSLFAVDAAVWCLFFEKVTNDVVCGEIFFIPFFSRRLILFMAGGGKENRAIQSCHFYVFRKQSEIRKTNCSVKRINLASLIKEISEF